MAPTLPSPPQVAGSSQSIGCAAALTMASMAFASALTGMGTTRTITGHLEPGAADFIDLPVAVPARVNKISVVDPTAARGDQRATGKLLRRRHL
jgi:hypothetical protein